MSKAIKSVGGAIFGSGSSSGALGTGQFRAQTRKIDKEAFKIKKSEDASKRSEEREESATKRSEKAQQDRSSLITNLQNQASGQAPSLAEAQLKSASERSLAQQLAASQSQRGGSAASRERQLLRGQATAGRDLAQQAAEARLQERGQAQQLLGQQISQEQQLADQMTQNYLAQGFNIEQARQQAAADFEKLEVQQLMQSQGLNLSGFQSAATNRGQLVGGALGAVGLSDERAKTKIKKIKKNEFKNLAADNKKESEKEIIKREDKEMIRAFNKKQAQKGKELSNKRHEKKQTEKDSKQEGHNAIGAAFGKGLKNVFSDKEIKINKREVSDSSLQKVDVPKPPTSGNKEKGGMSDMSKMAPMAAALSDKNSKSNMKAYSDKNIKKDFLDKLKAYTYEYKDKFKSDPRAGEGRHMSVMAQDLEKAGPIGKSMVQETEEGVKAVDYAKGYGAILAAQAHLNKRLDEIENKKSKRSKTRKA